MQRSPPLLPAGSEESGRARDGRATHERTCPFSHMMFTAVQILRVWGGGAQGALAASGQNRILGSWESQNGTRKEQLAASRKPFFAGSIALSPLRKGPLSKERPRSTGDCAGLAQERSHSPQLWWLVQTPRPVHYGLKACSQIMSRQFITTVVLEIFSTMATAMS